MNHSDTPSEPEENATDTEKMVYAARKARQVYIDILAIHGLTPQQAAASVTRAQANKIMADVQEEVRAKMANDAEK